MAPDSYCEAHNNSFRAVSVLDCSLAVSKAKVVARPHGGNKVGATYHREISIFDSRHKAKRVDLQSEECI